MIDVSAAGDLLPSSGTWKEVHRTQAETSIKVSTPNVYPNEGKCPRLYMSDHVKPLQKEMDENWLHNNQEQWIFNINTWISNMDAGLISTPYSCSSIWANLSLFSCFTFITDLWNSGSLANAFNPANCSKCTIQSSPIFYSWK